MLQLWVILVGTSEGIRSLAIGIAKGADLDSRTIGCNVPFYIPKRIVFHDDRITYIVSNIKIIGFIIPVLQGIVLVEGNIIYGMITLWVMIDPLLHLLSIANSLWG